MRFKRRIANVIILGGCACTLLIMPQCSCAVSKPTSIAAHCDHTRRDENQGHPLSHHDNNSHGDKSQHDHSSGKSCCSSITVIQNTSFSTVSDADPQSLLITTLRSSNFNPSARYVELQKISETTPLHPLFYLPQFYKHTRGPPAS